MIEIYTIYGGDMWRSALNGVVTILGTSSFHTLMRIAETFSVLTAVACFISKRNPMVFVSWAAIFMLITSVLLVPKRSVQIIDITNQGAVYEVDNVPVGLAAIAGLTTGVGYNTASLFDYTLARPDSLTYTKTGMLFGSQIIAESSDFQTQNPQLAQALSNYVESCVVGDILLNHKYTTGDLLNSSDPLTLITSQPLYATYGYVASPGGRDNDTGTVLASLNARDLNTQNVSALAASGDRAEIYTGETLQKAEEKLGRMQQNASPLTLVRRASGEEAVEPGSAAPASSIEEIKAPPEDENGKPTVTLSAEQQRRVEIGVTGAIVEDYVGRTAEARQNTIIITQLNDDRKTINAGIHAALQERGVISQQELAIPVLERVSHARHDFNQIDKWSSGLVILQGDRYLDVVNVDTHGRLVTLRDASGRLSMMSPFELDTGQIEVFEKQSLAVAVGDELRFNKTVRPDGHMANEPYKVAVLNDNGTLVLKGAQGQKTVNPTKNQSDQHLDYAWAVTGHGAQGASRDFEIGLEGTTGARGRMANRREFYINVSRARKHVQIYTDGLQDWLKQVTRPDNALATAHDALKPETERQQAKAIWSMGSPVAKTGIGRMWQKQNDLKDPSLTARIIPQTRKFPQPHLALPVYDNFGKSAGVVMYPLTPDAQGTLTPGAPRLVATDRAQGAVVRRSHNGETLLATSAADALELARQHPQSGIVLQTGEQAPSAQLIKLTKGELVAHQDPIVRAAKQVAQHIDMENRDYSEAMSRMEAGLEDHDETERQWEQQMKDAAKDVSAGLQQAKEEQQHLTLPDLGKNSAEDVLQQRIVQVIGSEKESAIPMPKGIEPPSVNENPRLQHDISSAKENLRSTQETERAQARDISIRELAIERGEYAKPSGRPHHIQKER